MDALWVGLGTVVLLLTLLDVFLTALNYDEAGFLAGRLASWQWRLVRRFTRRLPRRWRPVVLRQVIGLQVMITVAAWLAGVIIGYALIYLGHMHGNSFKYTGGSADLFSALYLSAGQLATVGGTGLLMPDTPLLEALIIAESLTGVVLVSLTLTFLLGVYDVISSLRSLSSQFYNAGAGVGDPLATLTPYFPNGEERGLDSHLDSLSDSFGAYMDGIRLHHAAYYFQSGRDTFSLPYSIHMLGGVVQALRWGLPRSHPVAQEPTLLPLTDQFERFEEYLHELLQWQSTGVPETVDASTFAEQVTDLRINPGADPVPWRTAAPDPWVRGFVQMNVAMAELVRSRPLTDLNEAYERYVEWLPFAYRAQQFGAAVAHDLDYQPLYSGPQNDVPVVSPARPTASSLRRAVVRAKEVFADRVTFIDPGYVRLLDAFRVMCGTVLAVGVVAIGFSLADEPLMPGAVFAGFVAMLASAGSVGRGRGLGRLVDLVALVPVLLALVLDAVVRHGTLSSSTALVVVAVLSVLAGLYGPRIGRLGVLAFIIYYFTVLLRLERSDLLLLTIPAVVGVVCSTLARMVPDRGARARVVAGGVTAFEERLARSLDPLIDAVSASRWDPDLQHRIRSQMNQTHHMAAFLVGQLTQGTTDVGLTTEQARAVCLRVHDAELALENLVAVARMATGAGMPLSVRAQLAGTLEAMQQHVAAYPGRAAWVTSSADGSPPESHRSEPFRPVVPTGEELSRWPRSARRVLLAAERIQETTDGLHSARSGDLFLTEGEVKALLPSFDPPFTTGRSAAARRPRRVTKDEAAPLLRRSVQAGTATAVALFLASFVSATHQYWAGMPAYQVIGGTDGEAFTKGVRKVVGTILGAIVGFAIAIESDRSAAVLLPVLALCVFAATYFRQASVPLAAFWQTMLFAQLYEYLGRLDAEAVGVRVVETAIGAVVALVVSAVVLPTRARSRLSQQATTLIGTVRSTARDALEVWRRGRPVSVEEAAAFSRDVEKMDADLRALHDTVSSVRLGPGAFDPSGIQNQLSRFWELVYHVKSFVTTTEQARTDDTHVTAEQWAQLETQTSQNFDALEAAYDARPAGAIDPDLALVDLDDEGESDVTRRALRSLARANQTVAIIASDTVTQPEEPGEAGA
ncbi:FUSC family protein [Aeromicrobium chenweiae]|uniref:Integral membrane bound transporter domain-containing protein n=1 Tax=Aeromicrobium chenweiae TaxID=2079793 RepID=A0A2S0WLY0_9ACTN|nr:FUSC family protein [Aeromicrobium chenweiae]AWB92321.1 hypothetical protein C3E78_08980 [Aeromicrobium chenweiae]TGN31393.1 FUSC family protein [Aeromicrobium chenweiae]